MNPAPILHSLVKRFAIVFQLCAATTLFAATVGMPIPLSPQAPAAIEPNGTLDAAFNAGNFTNGTVISSVLQPDGKVLIGGLFSKVHGVRRPGIARLNADGTLDSSFNPPIDTVLNAQKMLLQSDGKVIVFGGSGSMLNLARLNGDGSVDSSFTLDRTASLDGFDNGGKATKLGIYNSGILQADGKLILVGHFFYVITGPGTSVARSCVARFNTDGTLDTSYYTSSGVYNSYDFANGPSVSYIVKQNLGADNGKVVIEGSFDTFNNGAQDQHSNLLGLIRLNTDGSFDTTFYAGFNNFGPTGADVLGLLAQTDDKIVVFGYPFSPFGGAIGRLESSGAQDNGFVAPALLHYDGTSRVFAVAQQPNGKLVVGGMFHFAGGSPSNNLVRLEINGARDATFDSVTTGPSGNSVSTILVRPSDGRILVGGHFSSYGGAPRNNLAWANADGTVAATFDNLSGATESSAEVYAVALQPDGKILVGGNFTSFQGKPHYNLVRLNGDSTIDPSFDPNFGTQGTIRSVLLQPDGKIVIAGGFVAVNGVAKGHVVRLNSDGSLDSSFDAGTGTDGTIYAMSRDSAGNFYIGGSFAYVNGELRVGVAKLTPTGALDTAFNSSGGGANSTVFSLTEPDSSGNIVVGGQFNNYNGVTKRNVARLNATTGELDASFNNSTIFLGIVFAVLPTPDGKYYIAGSNLSRLNSDGTKDTSFTSATGGYSRYALALQNNKLYVGGTGTGDGTIRPLVRLTDTGTVDPSFNTGTGVGIIPNTYLSTFPEVRTLVVQPDGKLLFGGLFNKYNGTPRVAVARLTGPGDPALASGSVGNVSTRLPVGTGDNALIEGFIVDGPAGSTKKIIVRAIGPSLLPFGVSDALLNPTLEIHDASGATVAMNNDWKTTQVGGLITGDQTGEISNSGVAPSNDLESALIADLAPGGYTAVVHGANNTTGTGVVDAYDLSASSPAKLANIATRGLVQAGDKLMIAGFIIQNGQVKAVIRAIGPSLQASGISNALTDTTLELRNQDGTFVMVNDNWQTDQKQELENTGLQPSHDLEAALVTDIPPGSYTAQVRGKDNTSGIGVVQVYFLQ